MRLTDELKHEHFADKCKKKFDRSSLNIFKIISAQEMSPANFYLTPQKTETKTHASIHLFNSSIFSHATDWFIRVTCLSQNWEIFPIFKLARVPKNIQ